MKMLLKKLLKSENTITTNKTTEIDINYILLLKRLEKYKINFNGLKNLKFYKIVKVV